MDPTTIAGALFSGLNAIVKGVSYGAHFVDVPKEVTQLQQNIQTADQSINTAKRLVRLKSHYLNPYLVKESQSSIDAVENVLRHVRDSIEDCRKDLEVKNTVSVKHRAIWVLWKNQEFLSKLETLNTCLGALNRDILRLEMASPPPVVLVGGVPFAPDYADAQVDPIRDPAATRLRSKPSFARSPSKRWLGNASTSTFDLNSSANTSRVNLRSMKSYSSITLSPESTHDLRSMKSNSSITLTSETNYFSSGLGDRIGHGDEGYQSDDGMSTRSSRHGQSHSTLFAKPDGTDPSISFVAGSGLSINLDDQRTSTPQSGSGIYARADHSYVSESIRPTVGIDNRHVPSAHIVYELPGSYPSLVPSPNSAVPDPFTSNNPWGEMTHELPIPDFDWDSRRNRGKMSDVPPIVEDEQDTDSQYSGASLLFPSVTAPASMVSAPSGTTPSTTSDAASLLSDYEQKRLRRRRRSDFIS
ncbi:hypothetical protein LTR10_017374 [Elasticomyces elasticus]|uniref:Fungal N-terminal domain-containing protein n=1 Tax=Exophiala sideris TaxID=1016849 RepID=A0ABR0J9E3_9EURO|nr:hypothetical protein LTR10_017374 [Elasticomyces elasticus]KAK5027870.1 hypothetical protein LTS07_006745 [Exophiala sideris]KAK5037540.1 hypothetical protein LTR13_004698 [Exophiala sideris]KAK5059201.1 hypothetical protein LTR69_006491 [Exophiala sideris]KAK5183036.1 hypothetical protein LTR44_004747 [Eurotiomycetes sp. CCFEE 6388]